jgi:hypothetical protein
MDCYLSASLGRPNGISIASATEILPLSSLAANTVNDSQNSDLHALDAAVFASQITGKIIDRFYTARKASRTVAFELSLHFNEWIKKLPPELHWEQIALDASDKNLTLKRLHVNLVYLHGVVLLTRPFLLYQISVQLKRSANRSLGVAAESLEPWSQGRSQNCFHGACVRSAVHMINIIHNTFAASALPRRDPFVM